MTRSHSPPCASPIEANPRAGRIPEWASSAFFCPASARGRTQIPQCTEFTLLLLLGVHAMGFVHRVQFSIIQSSRIFRRCVRGYKARRNQTGGSFVIQYSSTRPLLQGGVHSRSCICSSGISIDLTGSSDLAECQDGIRESERKNGRKCLIKKLL